MLPATRKMSASDWAELSADEVTSLENRVVTAYLQNSNSVRKTAKIVGLTSAHVSQIIKRRVPVTESESLPTLEEVTMEFRQMLSDLDDYIDSEEEWGVGAASLYLRRESILGRLMRIAELGHTPKVEEDVWITDGDLPTGGVEYTPPDLVDNAEDTL